ncbi:MAG: glycosyltransferase family 2 protein [Thermodesulfobacteriota bacterium]
MKTCLIITTYNKKNILRLVLRTAFVQTVAPTEIIVADDGSDPDTGELVKEMRLETATPVYHCWQEDKGFRPSRCRNMAIARSSADYCILIDGDIMLDEHFIEDHLHYATPGYFIQGSRVILSQQATESIIHSGNTRISFFDHEIGNRKNCIRSRLLSRFLSMRNKRLGGIKTCNFAFWKKDAIKVNGFNENFVGWGHEDTEFAARLLNIGIRRQNVKFNALAFHLYHSTQPRDALDKNDALLLETRTQKKIWCDNGLKEHIGNCGHCS